MTYEIILSNPAFNDLNGIKTYIAKDNPEIAKTYINRFFDRFENLKTFPKLGKPIQNKVFNYAKCYYLPCLNHVAIYQINEIAKCIYNVYLERKL